MSISVRTNYNSVKDGDLDPLWLKNGRHTSNLGWIGAENDPLGGPDRVTRYTVHDGDVFMGGERCETLTDRIGGPPGTRLQVAFELLLPLNFVSDSRQWNSLWDLHYPNTGLAQSPLTASIRSSEELWMRVYGGPGGNTQHDEKIATLSKGAWHKLGWDLLLDGQNGICDIYVDGTLMKQFRAPTIATGGNTDTYWKQGFYRSQSSSGTSSYYFKDTVCWYNNSPNEMIAFLGGSTPPPPPPPPPPPATFTASSSIQAGATLTVGDVLDWTVTTSTSADSCQYFVDSTSVNTAVGPATVFHYGLTVPRCKTVGFEATAGSSKVSFPSFPITVKEPPVPQPDIEAAKFAIQRSLDELRKSQSYQQYKKNGTLARSHLGKCESASLDALNALR